MAVLRRSIGPLVLAVGATLLGSGAKVGAQEAANPGQPGATPVAGLEEVVVTAQRRTEDLQRAAVAVTALSGADIAERGVTQLADLTQLVPAVEIDAGAGPYSGVSLRGVATTAVNSFADPAIAVNLDGIYLPRDYTHLGGKGTGATAYCLDGLPAAAGGPS